MLRTPYNYDRDAVSKDTGLVCHEETLTQQHFKDDCDIVKMIQKFGVLQKETPDFASFDATVYPDNYLELKTLLSEGEQAFMSLPSDVRAKHNNDIDTFVTWLNEEQVRIAKGNIKADKATKVSNDAVSQSNEVGTDTAAQEPTE